MPWFWARVHDRTQQLGYLRGGFQALYDRLAERIRELRWRGPAWASRSPWCVPDSHSPLRPMRDPRPSTASSPRSPPASPRASCPALPDAWRQRHEWGRAYGAHCVILALDRPLLDDPSVYWLNVNDPGFPFMALVEHTNYASAADYGGRHLIYLGNYRPMDDPLLAQPLPATLDEFLPHLARLNPAFDRSWLTDAWSFAAPFAQPIVTVDYRHHIPPFRTPVRNLWVASMFQVYPHDRGQNYSIALAERLVAALS